MESSPTVQTQNESESAGGCSAASPCLCSLRGFRSPCIWHHWRHSYVQNTTAHRALRCYPKEQIRKDFTRYSRILPASPSKEWECKSLQFFCKRLTEGTFFFKIFLQVKNDEKISGKFSFKEWRQTTQLPPTTRHGQGTLLSSVTGSSRSSSASPITAFHNKETMPDEILL